MLYVCVQFLGYQATLELYAASPVLETRSILLGQSAAWDLTVKVYAYHKHVERLLITTYILFTVMTGDY